MKFIRHILSPLLFMYNSVVRMLFLLLFVSTISFAGSAKAGLSDPELVASFYKRNGNKMFWFSGTSDGVSLRRQLIAFLTVSEAQGLHPRQYRIEELKMLSAVDDNIKEQHNADGLFTDVALAYMKDLLQGKLPPGFVSYDELSSAGKQRNNELIIDLLADCTDSASLVKTLKHLEPATSEYRLLKIAMANALQTGSTDTIQQLEIALNVYRWVHHFHSAKCIVVSIPSAKLYYYEHDSLKLEMKVVVGKPGTPTPRFAARCNEIILYPYWNVPQSIAINEFLPMCKKGYGVLDFMNMQVLDNKGRVLNPATIKWSAYNKNNFPFHFRQSTGCDNALGVIKFNLTSPYSVYLHDTNMKFAFQSDKRFLSHGCIRIEKPVELCRKLLDGVFDQSLVDACVRNQKPVNKTLSAAVPIFVIYTTADCYGQKVRYYPDVYKLNPMR